MRRLLFGLLLLLTVSAPLRLGASYQAAMPEPGNATYHYDLAGRRVGLAYPSGSNITTTFDALGRQIEIKGTGNATTTRYDFNLSYDKYSNLGKQAETYANGTITSRNVTLTYDNADRLTQEVLAVTGATAVTSNYTYDAAFNRLTKVTTQGTTQANITYHYNAGDELTWYHDTTANVTANFTYDTAGNRITQTYQAAMPEPGNVTNAPVITTNTTYTYLQVGTDNFLASANLTTGWWKAGTHKLQEVTETSQFNYDDQARRQFEDRFDTYYFDSNVTHTGYGTVSGNYAGSLFSRSETAAVKLYDGEGVVRAYQGVYNTLGGNTGNLTTVSEDWVRGSDWGGGIGGILYSQSLSGNANTAKYYHYDGRGDVVALTSNIGAVSYQAAYDAYGTHANTSTKGTEESGTDTDPFRTNTREEWISADATTFVNERHRPRGLDTATYWTKDPLGQAAGPNPYTYVGQDEWTKTDPEGLLLDLGTQSPTVKPSPIDMTPPVVPPTNPVMQGIDAFAFGYYLGHGVDSIPKIWGGKPFSQSFGEGIGHGLGYNNPLPPAAPSTGQSSNIPPIKATGDSPTPKDQSGDPSGSASSDKLGGASPSTQSSGGASTPPPNKKAPASAAPAGDPNRRKKVPKPGVDGKAGAKDIPSWAEGQRPYEGESGKEFAQRLLDEKYGSGNYARGPSSEFNQIQKYGDRSFQDPPPLPKR